AFYARLLGWTVVDEAGPRPGAPPQVGWVQLRPPSGGPGVSLSFEFEAAYVPPVWPSVAGEQQIMTHIDIAVEDLEAAVAWSVEAGGHARRAPATAACARDARPGRAPVLSLPRAGLTLHPALDRRVRSGKRERKTLTTVLMLQNSSPLVYAVST